jgi:hypothetical protein
MNTSIAARYERVLRFTPTTIKPIASLPTHERSLLEVTERHLAPRFRNGNAEVICVMKSDGPGLVQVTSDPAFDYYPSWSPDGTKIAFHSFRDGITEVCAVNANGTAPVNLTNNPASDAFAYSAR